MGSGAGNQPRRPRPQALAARKAFGGSHGHIGWLLWAITVLTPIFATELLLELSTCVDTVEGGSHALFPNGGAGYVAVHIGATSFDDFNLAIEEVTTPLTIADCNLASEGLLRVGQGLGEVDARSTVGVRGRHALGLETGSMPGVLRLAREHERTSLL
jgi:hypothetical protein